MKSIKIAQVLFVLLAATACTPSMGPSTVAPDRIAYGTSMSESTKQQLLMNMVRMRYAEAPAFVEVASIIDQYSREGSATGSLGFGNSFTGEDTQILGASGKWVDRPTITYTPISGQAFARSLMTPIMPEAIISLVQSGWSPSVLLGLSVSSINRVRNDTASPANRRDGDPEFWELLDLWERLRNEQAIAIRVAQKDKERKALVLTRDDHIASDVQNDLARFREILGLTTAGPYTMVFGSASPAPNEIAVLSRSMLEIMVNLSWYMRAPAAHVRNGRTRSRMEPTGGDLSAWVDVQHACTHPGDAYVAVFNRGYWFWIDDSDMKSKATFAVLELILSLADTGAQAEGPVVTIGN